VAFVGKLEVRAAGGRGRSFAMAPPRNRASGISGLRCTQPPASLQRRDYATFFDYVKSQQKGVLYAERTTFRGHDWYLDCDNQKNYISTMRRFCIVP
jgi:hypothetical protein